MKINTSLPGKYLLWGVTVETESRWDGSPWARRILCSHGLNGGHIERLRKGRETLTGKSGEGWRVGGGKASPFPMPTASMLKVNWPRPRPRPPPRLAMVEGAWIRRDPVRKT